MILSNEELESQIRARDASLHIAYRQMRALERIAEVAESMNAIGRLAAEGRLPGKIYVNDSIVPEFWNKEVTM